MKTKNIAMVAAALIGCIITFNAQNTGLPTVDQLKPLSTLPDPFAWNDGSGRSTDAADWPRHRQEIKQLIRHYETGCLPDVPRDSIEAVMDADTLRIKVHANGQTLDMSATILYPDKGDAPYPAMICIAYPFADTLTTRLGVARVIYNFGQVMSHTQTRGNEPINRLYPDNTEVGAYGAWPWGVSRLIDALEIAGPEASRIDTSRLGITGCSFAGKMALFSGAMDERIALTIAQEPGGGGAAAWRVSETLGNVETLARTNYAWFLESLREFAETDVNRLPYDHHELVALVAPRALFVLGNTDYEWLADESGYVSCRAARKVWEKLGVCDHMGFSIEGGHMHCMLPDSQIPETEAFIRRFLLGEDADTNISRAPMFENVDWQRWIEPWRE